MYALLQFIDGKRKAGETMTNQPHFRLGGNPPCVHEVSNSFVENLIVIDTVHLNLLCCISYLPDSCHTRQNERLSAASSDTLNFGCSFV